MARVFFLSFILLATIVGGGASAYAEPVRVRAAIHGESGRIAFSWDFPVSYSARISGSQLIVSFDRLIETNLNVIQQTLPGYVERGEISGDGKTVTLYLTKPFELVHFPAGTAVVVDLIGKPGVEENTKAVQEPAPETVAKPAVENEVANAPVQNLSGLQEISVRTGRHADKLRLVFDWPKQVNYRVDRSGGIARLIFDSPARILVDDLGSVMPDVLGDARATVEGGKTVVSLAIAEGARLRHFHAGDKMVLDAYIPNDGSKAAKLPAARESTETADVSALEQSEASVSEQPAPTVTEPSAENSTTDEGATAASTPKQDNAASAAPTAPTALTPPGEAMTQQTPSSSASETDTGFSLRFGWDEPVAAAVFRRGGALWIIFDKPTVVDVAAMRAVAGDAFRDLTQLSHPTATVLRVVTERGINPIPKREGLAWIMEFAEQGLSTLSPIEATAQPDSTMGARVFLPVPEPGRAVPVTDPEMGDNFIVVPVIPLGYGVTHHYVYPQFRIRPSSQGLVVEPSIDTLRVRPVRQGVGITSTRTLHLSPVSEEDIAKARSDSNRPMSRIVDLEPLQSVSIEFFNETRQGLEHDIAFAKGDNDRTTGRLELIRFYLAHGMAAEALGVLKVLADDIPKVKKRADFRLYRGMANFFMSRYEDAAADLASEKLDGNDEGIFWRSIVDFASGNDDPVSMRGVRSTSTIPETYPRAMRVPLTFWVVDASVRVTDTEKAKEILDTLNAEYLTDAERSQVTYFLGLNSEIIGDFEEAIFNWEMTMQGDHPPSKVHAALARAELLLKMERISPLEAIDEFEKLRFAWRGGDFEFNLLRRLGVMYLRQGRFRDGLKTLRQAATYFRKRGEAQHVTQQMSDTFSALFLNGVADRMAPVSAIALYEEFKELTPVADLGNEMIRKLADRLVGVDLLDEAASLLDDQIKFRLKGVEKARIGAQLAVVRILAKDYSGALEALEISEEEGVTSELSTQRLQLKARALLGVGETLAALALIEEDPSLEAEKLRTEAYWSSGDWPQAAKALRELVKASGAKPGERLDQEQAMHVLNYAIALTLGGNDRALMQLRQDYRAGMDQTDVGDAFSLIATPEQFGLIEYDTIASRVQVAENFRDFMAAYVHRLESGGLSSIN